MKGKIEKWVDRIRSNDPSQVAALYCDDGLLLGTFSSQERKGMKPIFNYFENLLKSQIDVEIITQNIVESDSLCVNSGLYNFIVDRKVINARFSFVFKKVNDSWKILSHHSSALPEKK